MSAHRYLGVDGGGTKTEFVCIDAAGAVGPIGGIPLKMIRAREAGASVFLVPAGNCAEAVQRAPAGLRLVRVDTLADAVHALDEIRAGQQPRGCAS